MFNKKLNSDQIDRWKCVYETSIESEARLVQAFLKDSGLECQVLSKKDSAYTVTFGDLSALFVYVPEEQAQDAEQSLREWKDGSIDQAVSGTKKDSDGDDEADV